MIFVGDVHRNIAYLEQVVNDASGEDIVVLGDLGIGTIPEIDHAFVKLFRESPNLFTIRGNHDHLDTIRKLDGFIPDGTVRQTNMGPMMFIGGAKSRDRDDRTPQMDWWPDEEVDTSDFYQFQQVATNVDPTFMVSHDCPAFVIDSDQPIGGFDRTKVALGVMYTRISPRLHIFGHHHVTWQKKIGETEFLCVGIDESHRVEGMKFIDSEV